MHHIMSKTATTNNQEMNKKRFYNKPKWLANSKYVVSTTIPVVRISGFSPGPQLPAATWSVLGGTLIGNVSYSQMAFLSGRDATIKTPDGSLWLYWNNAVESGESYVRINVSSSFRIWSYFSSPYDQYASLKITNEATGLIVPNLVTVLTHPNVNDSWTLASSTIPAGTYTINTYGDSTYSFGTGYRLDGGWFLEAK